MVYIFDGGLVLNNLIIFLQLWKHVCSYLLYVVYCVLGWRELISVDWCSNCDMYKLHIFVKLMKFRMFMKGYLRRPFSPVQWGSFLNSWHVKQTGTSYYWYNSRSHLVQFLYLSMQHVYLEHLQYGSTLVMIESLLVIKSVCCSSLWYPAVLYLKCPVHISKHTQAWGFHISYWEMRMLSIFAPVADHGNMPTFLFEIYL